MSENARAGRESGLARAVGMIAEAGALLAGLCILLMTIAGTMDVVGTFALGRPLPGAFEFIQTMMVAAVTLPIAMAQRQGRHIRVTLFLRYMPARCRIVLDMAGVALTLIFFALLAWFGWMVAFRSLAIGEFSSGLIPFPIWPAKLALAAGVSLMVIQSLMELSLIARHLVLFR